MIYNPSYFIKTISYPCFLFYFFYKTVVWNCKKSAHEMEMHYSGGFTLPTKLFILSEKEIKLSLYDLLLIKPRHHLFTTHTAVVDLLVKFGGNLHSIESHSNALL